MAFAGSAGHWPTRASRSSSYSKIPQHHARLRERFLEEIFPVLTPLAVDPGHPFPYISTLSLSLAVGLRDPETGERRFARIKVPPVLPRLRGGGAAHLGPASSRSSPPTSTPCSAGWRSSTPTCSA